MVPALASLFCTEHERQNQKSGNDKMLYTYPINLCRFRSAGMIAISIKVFWVYLVMGVVLVIVSRFFGMQRVSSATVVISFVALYLCSLWMIPGCLLLGRHLNIYILMSVHVICNILLPPFIAGTPFWIICPYCYGPKAIEALSGIKISGDYITAVGVNFTVIIAVLTSVALFATLAVLESMIYGRGYMEKRVRRK